MSRLRPLISRVGIGLVAVAVLASACGASTTEIVAAPGADTTQEAPGAAAAAPDEQAPTEDATEPATAEPATAAPLPTVAAPTRSIPPGWTDFDAGSYNIAMPSTWITITDIDEIDAMLDEAGNVTDVPAAALNQYRSVLAGGNAIVGLGSLGDNFNAFRQRGDASEFNDVEGITELLTTQFETFAQNVSIDARPRFFGDLAGLYTSGSYVLNGQQLFLYQFGTANGDHVYYFTVTLFTGSDQELADQFFNSITFDAS